MSDTCAKDFCEKVFIPQIDAEAVEFQKKLAKSLKIKKMKPTPMTKKHRKSLYDSCVKVHCNPSCEGTIFNKFKIDSEKKKKLNKLKPKERAKVMKLIKYMQDAQRKEISKYNPPLKDGFYRGLKASNIKTLKKSGAKSACTTVLTKEMFRKAPKIFAKTIKRR